MLFKAHTVAKRALEDKEALRMRCTTLPAIIELSGLVDRPLQEDEKLPLLPEDMAVFPYDDSCLEADAKVLFRIGSHRTRIASEILSIISQGPPPDNGTESSFIFFWDFNIRRILELLTQTEKVFVTRLRISTGYLRPDYGFLLNKLCVFRGEEERPSSQADPRMELPNKLQWAYI